MHPLSVCRSKAGYFVWFCFYFISGSHVSGGTLTSWINISSVRHDKKISINKWICRSGEILCCSKGGKKGKLNQNYESDLNLNCFHESAEDLITGEHTQGVRRLFKPCWNVSQLRFSIMTERMTPFEKLYFVLLHTATLVITAHIKITSFVRCCSHTAFHKCVLNSKG